MNGPALRQLIGGGRQQPAVHMGPPAKLLSLHGVGGVPQGVRRHLPQLFHGGAAQVFQQLLGGFPQSFFGRGGAQSPNAAAALQDSALEPFVRGEEERVCTLMQPADWPSMVIFSGSPPKAAMFSRTHCRAKIWSRMP